MCIGSSLNTAKKPQVFSFFIRDARFPFLGSSDFFVNFKFKVDINRIFFRIFFTGNTVSLIKFVSENLKALFFPCKFLNTMCNINRDIIPAFCFFGSKVKSGKDITARTAGFDTEPHRGCSRASFSFRFHDHKIEVGLFDKGFEARNF